MWETPLYCISMGFLDYLHIPGRPRLSRKASFIRKARVLGSDGLKNGLEGQPFPFPCLDSVSLQLQGSWLENKALQGDGAYSTILTRSISYCLHYNCLSLGIRYRFPPRKLSTTSSNHVLNETEDSGGADADDSPRARAPRDFTTPPSSVRCWGSNMSPRNLVLLCRSPQQSLTHSSSVWRQHKPRLCLLQP